MVDFCGGICRRVSCGMRDRFGPHAHRADQMSDADGHAEALHGLAEIITFAPSRPFLAFRLLLFDVRPAL